jgi:hypothetical protein
MVKSVFRYLHFLRSYRHVSHYPLESNMAANKMELVNACNSPNGSEVKAFTARGNVTIETVLTPLPPVTAEWHGKGMEKAWYV